MSASGDQISNIALRLGATKILLDLFPEQPPLDYVHVIVQVPKGEMLPLFIRSIHVVCPTDMASPSTDHFVPLSCCAPFALS